MDNEQKQNKPIPVSLSDKKPAFCSWVRYLDDLIKEFEIDID